MLELVQTVVNVTSNLVRMAASHGVSSILIRLEIGAPKADRATYFVWHLKRRQ